MSAPIAHNRFLAFACQRCLTPGEWGWHPD